MDRTAVVNQIAERVMKEITPQKRVNVVQEQTQLISQKHVPVAYYDSESRLYFMLNERGHWTGRTLGDFKRYLERVVFHHLTRKEGRDEMVEDFIITTQNKFDVSLAIPLAGHPTGEFNSGQHRILVTKEAKYLKPRKGEWPLFKRFLETLLPGQLDHLYGWLKCRFNALRAGPPFRPGQLLVIGGEKGCGKSYLQNKLTDLFGGRAASPFDYMMGVTDKNSELFYAEHLMIEDEASSPLHADRTHFGSKIKTMLVNQWQKFHKKFGEPVRLSPFWIGTLSLNDNPEALLVVPPIREDIVDKVIILRASHAYFPPFKDDYQRQEFDQAVVAELPAFLAFLNTWRIPDELKDPRYGTKAWHHPDLLEAINQLDPATSLLELIDDILPLTLDGFPFRGTSAKLKKILLEHDKLGRTKEFTRHASTVGTYLARLKKSHPQRIDIDGRPSNKCIWIIKKEVS